VSQQLKKELDGLDTFLRQKEQRLKDVSVKVKRQYNVLEAADATVEALEGELK
ncbi:hypothetical protein THOM_2783, partial [Trachipleistophora hominis]